MFSQLEEEKYIIEACGSIAPTVTEEGTRIPRFLDIGAWDPITFSNTRELFLRGWSGVMIEPSPGPLLKLLDAYGNEPRVEIVAAAVALEKAPIKFHITDDAVSSADGANYERWKDHAKYLGVLTVPVLTLEEISNQFGGFDFINIDAEGISADLFLRVMALEWEPRCICVEHDGRTTELLEAATKRQYHAVYGNQNNIVVVR